MLCSQRWERGAPPPSPSGAGRAGNRRCLGALREPGEGGREGGKAPPGAPGGGGAASPGPAAPGTAGPAAVPTGVSGRGAAPAPRRGSGGRPAGPAPAGRRRAGAGRPLCLRRVPAAAAAAGGCDATPQPGLPPAPARRRRSCQLLVQLQSRTPQQVPPAGPRPSTAPRPRVPAVWLAWRPRARLPGRTRSPDAQPPENTTQQGLAGVTRASVPTASPGSPHQAPGSCGFLTRCSSVLLPSLGRVGNLTDKGCQCHVNCQVLRRLKSLQGWRVVFIWSVDPCGSASCLYSIRER